MFLKQTDEREREREREREGGGGGAEGGKERHKGRKKHYLRFTGSKMSKYGRDTPTVFLEGLLLLSINTAKG